MLFIFAGGLKIYQPSNFAASLIYTYKFPHVTGVVIATVLPILEVVIGLGLVLRYRILLARLGARVLIGSFLIFHLWSLLILGITESCNCFGDIFQFDSRYSMVVVLVMSVMVLLLKVQPEQEENKVVKNTMRAKVENIIIGLTLIVVVGFALVIRYNKLDSELKYDLITNSHIPVIKARIESDFRKTNLIQKSSFPTMILILRSPGCDKCMSELLFWNASSYKNQINIVGLFPNEVTDTEHRLLDLFKVQFPVKSISPQLYEEIGGKHPRFVTRLVFNGEGGFLYASRGGESDIERAEFVKHIDSFLVATNKKLF